MKPEEDDRVLVPKARYEAAVARVAGDFLALLPAHKAGLILSHNDHLTLYETVSEWIGQMGENGPDWVSDEEKARGKETNEMWELHWYPNTPVGFNHVAASSLVALLAYVAQMEQE